MYAQLLHDMDKMFHVFDHLKLLFLCERFGWFELRAVQIAIETTVLDIWIDLLTETINKYLWALNWYVNW